MTTSFSFPTNKSTSDNIKIRGKVSKEYREILTPEALEFIAMLQRRFGPERERLLKLREKFSNNSTQVGSLIFHQKQKTYATKTGK
jgi:malate synthase